MNSKEIVSYALNGNGILYVKPTRLGFIDKKAIKAEVKDKLNGHRKVLVDLRGFNLDKIMGDETDRNNLIDLSGLFRGSFKGENVKIHFYCKSDYNSIVSGRINELKGKYSFENWNKKYEDCLNKLSRL